MNEYESTTTIRKAMIASGVPQADLAAETGQTWDTRQLAEDFTVIGFAAPFVIVRRKADDVLGSLEFTHSPRTYFSFAAAS
jgi:hypothetical protein